MVNVRARLLLPEEDELFTVGSMGQFGLRMTMKFEEPPLALPKEHCEAMPLHLEDVSPPVLDAASPRLQMALCESRLDSHRFLAIVSTVLLHFALVTMVVLLQHRLINHVQPFVIHQPHVRMPTAAILIRPRCGPFHPVRSRHLARACLEHVFRLESS